MAKFVTTLRCIGITLWYTFRVFVFALLTRDPEKKWFHPLARKWAHALLKTADVHIAVYGRENVQENARYVFVANHTSYFDIPIAIAALAHDVVIVYKEELERVPIFGWMMKISPYIPIDRKNPRRAVAALQKALQKSRDVSLLLFPEGTRSRDGQVQPFKRGAFLLAEYSGLPIVPVAICGAYALLPRDRWLVQPSQKITVHIHPPITPRVRKEQQELRNLPSYVENIIRLSLQENG